MAENSETTGLLAILVDFERAIDGDNDRRAAWMLEHEEELRVWISAARLVDPPLKEGLETCVGCGHRLSRHRVYANSAVNRHGSPLVCIADNCQLWQECRLPEGTR